MKNKTLIFVLLFFTTTGFAQLKLAGVEYTNFAKAKFTEGEDDEESSFQEITAFFNLPMKLKNEKTTIINGVSYTQVRSTLYNSPFFNGDEVDKNLHSISYALTLVQKLNSKWTALVRLRPTLASDFEDDLNKDDFLFLGTAMATRSIGKHMVVGGGIVYTTQTGEPLFLPVVKFQFKNRKNNLDILLPSHVKFLHGIGARQKISIGAKAMLNGGNFGVTINEFAAADPATIDKLIYSRTNVGLLASIRMYRVVNLELFGGYSVNRKYKFEDTDIDDPFEYDSDNGPFFSVGISLVPKRKGAGD